MKTLMPCTLARPCGNRLRTVVTYGFEFSVYECVNGHSFRIGSPPPPAKPGPRDVVATALTKPWDRRAHEREVLAQGRCAKCKRLRGVKGTKHHCRRCADAMNRVSLKWQRKKGYARRRAVSRATKDEHARQMSGIKKKERA